VVHIGVGVQYFKKVYTHENKLRNIMVSPSGTHKFAWLSVSRISAKDCRNFPIKWAGLI
jgi:hypothetical protein